ncbi:MULTISPECIES: prepilin-type N-terminal cleavage/methylation domain-containing protein [Ramlibacter]|uniref:Prepilin-type N-terminal cleavage/methylation domain-containing protein n=1 Tax=Ramlibacter aquaticus TaxID=2780094 RepID=A0ABR9SK19_9BURK|nr:MULTISPECIES: prepilin-type N-terminal cleavage/methylation domain-containing protein [Ramlibacter]MBE7942711.1 prepilin-type N-terminal cleavage/methylation domain-containing protein [Ramlibacter aquaticus]
MRRLRGFTLVELMVALFAMALLAVMSWRGLDGMVRARETTVARSDQVLTLQVGLAQWGADLDALAELPATKAIEWNGRVLRLVRRDSGDAGAGVRVVGWTRRLTGTGAMWSRWESAPVSTRGDLQAAWDQADLWAQNQGQGNAARQVDVMPLDDWQIFFFRENAWTNPQSSDIDSSVSVVTRVGQLPSSLTRTPDGVRLVLVIPGSQAIAGTLTRDWARPTLGGNKS